MIEKLESFEVLHKVAKKQSIFVSYVGLHIEAKKQSFLTILCY